MEEPQLTESLPRWGKEGSENSRELLGAGPNMPAYFHQHPRSSVPEADTSTDTTHVVGRNKNTENVSIGVLDGQGSGACEEGDDALSSSPKMQYVPTSVLDRQEGGTCKGGENALSSPISCAFNSTGSSSGRAFLWKKTSWPGGARRNSLAVTGGGVLLSKRGWGNWRVWAGATSGDAGDAGRGDGEERGDSSGGDALGPESLSSAAVAAAGCQPQQGASEQQRAAEQVEEKEGQGELAEELSTTTANNYKAALAARSAAPRARKIEDTTATTTAVTIPTANSSRSRSRSRGRRPSTGGSGEANDNNDDNCDEAALIAEMASDLNVHVAGTCLVLEPWDYGCCGDRGMGGREAGGSGNGGGGVVAVRVDLAARSTSAFFLGSRWEAEGSGGAGGSSFSM